MPFDKSSKKYTNKVGLHLIFKPAASLSLSLNPPPGQTCSTDFSCQQHLSRRVEPHRAAAGACKHCGALRDCSRMSQQPLGLWHLQNKQPNKKNKFKFIYATCIYFTLAAIIKPSAVFLSDSFNSNKSPHPSNK